MIDARGAEISDAEPNDRGAPKQIEKTVLVGCASLTRLLVQTLNQRIPLRHAKPSSIAGLVAERLENHGRQQKCRERLDEEHPLPALESREPV